LFHNSQSHFKGFSEGNHYPKIAKTWDFEKKTWAGKTKRLPSAEIRSHDRLCRFRYFIDLAPSPRGEGRDEVVLESLSSREGRDEV